MKHACLLLCEIEESPPFKTEQLSINSNFSYFWQIANKWHSEKLKKICYEKQNYDLSQQFLAPDLILSEIKTSFDDFHDTEIPTANIQCKETDQ